MATTGDGAQREPSAAASGIRTIVEAIKANRDETAALRRNLDLLTAEISALRVENETLSSAVRRPTGSGLRAEETYLNIIGGLLALMTGKTPAGKPQSVFKNEAAIIDAMIAHHGGTRGIAKRTLEEKFAAAKRKVDRA